MDRRWKIESVENTAWENKTYDANAEISNKYGSVIFTAQWVSNYNEVVFVRDSSIP